MATLDQQEEQKTSFVDSVLSAIGPSQAEAMPIGKLIKAGSKAIPEGVSSAAERLVGTMFKGRKITNITKGAQQWRYIHLDDDTTYPATKDVINDLARAAGTATKLAEFSDKPEHSQLLQAYKSLQYHRQRSIPAASKLLIKDYNKRWQATMKEAGGEAPPMSMVQYGNEVFSMPTPYAKLLQSEGQVKLLKDLK
jgi:hypothetical protein